MYDCKQQILERLASYIYILIQSLSCNAKGPSARSNESKIREYKNSYMDKAIFYRLAWYRKLIIILKFRKVFRNTNIACYHKSITR